MAYIPCNYGSSGGTSVVNFFNNASFIVDNTSGTNSISVTSGKHYLLYTNRVATGTANNCSISSGATVDKTFVNNVVSSDNKCKTYIILCTATSSTITVTGTKNIIAAVQLD